MISSDKKGEEDFKTPWGARGLVAHPTIPGCFIPQPKSNKRSRKPKIKIAGPSTQEEDAAEYKDIQVVVREILRKKTLNFGHFPEVALTSTNLHCFEHPWGNFCV